MENLQESSSVHWSAPASRTNERRTQNDANPRLKVSRFVTCERWRHIL
ncbi:hypothetical protein glysoja_034116 [Glycine soja]|uniref:Uncharacterized protein n=1 Tax=Glycine soja TaxID=3848 RepID=A0A0B2PL21_GLYSO|nr:hypothetical protein glysoja_034116 [Glycine soja]